MKLFKKSAVFGMAAVLVCGVCALAACGEKDGADGVVGEVSDSEWEEILNFNVDACKSVTLTTRTYNTYSKEEAATYGEWGNIVVTQKIDQEKEIIYIKSTEEFYDAQTDEFKTDVDEDYYFGYNGKYYHWVKDGNATYNSETNQYEYSNAVYEITKTQFIENAESGSNICLQFQMYSSPEMKKVFQYNEETKMYDLMQFGTMKMSLQFLEDRGARIIMQATSVSTTESEVTAVDKTEVSVPAFVKADVDAYIAEKA